jgi:hypothetical protein
MYSGNSQYRNSPSILSAFTRLVKTSSEFLELLSSKFSENHFSSIILTFLTTNQDPPSLKCTLQSCERHRAFRQLRTNISLCEFILNLGFLLKSSLEHSTLVLALEKLCHLSSLTHLFECTTVGLKPVLPILLEEQATPFPQRDSHTWKENLANELIRDAGSRYDAIINTVGLVCRDLEQRCSTVESPLRRAQAEIITLNERIENITQNKLQLEESYGALMKEVDESRIQKDSLAHELRCARVEIEGCLQELGNAAAEKESVLMEFNNERNEWKEREEELMTTNGLLDDELNETQVNVKELRGKVAPCYAVLILDPVTRGGEECTARRN